MKKEDLAKINGGMFVFATSNSESYYDKQGEGYNGPRILSMIGRERDVLIDMGYNPIQVCGKFSTGCGGYIIKSNGKCVDPKDILELYESEKY